MRRKEKGREAGKLGHRAGKPRGGEADVAGPVFKL